MHIFLFIFSVILWGTTDCICIYTCMCRGLPAMWCVVVRRFEHMNYTIHLTVYPHTAIIPLYVMTKLICFVYSCDVANVCVYLASSLFSRKAECRICAYLYWFSSSFYQTGALWTRAKILFETSENIVQYGSTRFIKIEFNDL